MGQLRLIGDGIDENGESVRYFGIADELLIAFGQRHRPIGVSSDAWDLALRDALSDGEKPLVVKVKETVVREPLAHHG